ncbi:MAG: response regulator [Deltaproteobacteria bacterium]|nr:response regulator [Deltaproteobacteria bacterium]
MDAAAALGGTVELACDGAEACRAYAKGNIGVVVVECEMTPLDGLDVARAFRALERVRGSSSVPIIALTGRPERSSRAQALAAGVDVLLTKPVDCVALARVLASPRAPAVTFDEVPSLDFEAITNIRSLQRPDQPDVFAEVVEMFLSTSNDDVAALVAAAKRGELEVVYRIAHSMRSSTASIGARRLSEILGGIERDVRAGTMDLAKLGALEVENERARALLAAEVGESR